MTTRHWIGAVVLVVVGFVVGMYYAKGKVTLP